MYMQVQQRVQAKKTARAFVDLSRYTDMEVEHQHDTGSEIRKVGVGMHAHPVHNHRFNQQVESQYGDIKEKALQ